MADNESDDDDDKRAARVQLVDTEAVAGPHSLHVKRVADEDEARAAALQGQVVCPECGEWLPVELGEFRCAGKGNHYAISRTSIYPEGRPAPGPAEKLLRAERSFGRTVEDVVLGVFVIALVVLLATVAFCGEGRGL